MKAFDGGFDLLEQWDPTDDVGLQMLYQGLRWLDDVLQAIVPLLHLANEAQQAIVEVLRAIVEL